MRTVAPSFTTSRIDGRDVSYKNCAWLGVDSLPLALRAIACNEVVDNILLDGSSEDGIVILQLPFVLT